MKMHLERKIIIEVGTDTELEVEIFMALFAHIDSGLIFKIFHPTIFIVLTSEFLKNQ